MLGARGRLGRRIAQALADEGLAPVPLERDATPQDMGSRDVVVNAATDDPDLVTTWARAGASARGYVDTSHVHPGAVDVAGAAPVVAATGWFSGVGDALAVVAAPHLLEPQRADVTAWVPSRRSLLARATPRERQSLWRTVGRPVRVLVDGEVTTERIAADRRLAWFPRPVGPHHAAGVPAPHVHTLPRVVPSLTTVRSALALRSSSAEVLQALGALPSVRERIAAWESRSGGGTDDERWAMVAELATGGGDLVRAWANGHDRHGITAHVAALVAGRLDEGGGPRRPGAVGVTEVVPGEQLLDRLAAVTDLRWSVTARA